MVTRLFGTIERKRSGPVDLWQVPAPIGDEVRFLELSCPRKRISFRALAALQGWNLRGCQEVRDLTELSSLQKLNVGLTEISKLPGALQNLMHLLVLDVSECMSLTSIVGIAHVKTLEHVIECGCKNWRKMPKNFISLEKLEVLDQQGASLIRALPKDYGRFAGYSRSEGKPILEVQGCWGLVVPLLKKLRPEPEMSLAICMDVCICGREFMQAWVEARKKIDSAAYEHSRDTF